MDLRDSLLLILASAVALVFAHGVWRTYFGQPKLKIKLDKQFCNSSPMAEEDELSMLKAELPNGGARVVRTLSQEAVVRQHQGRTLLSPQIKPSLPRPQLFFKATILDAQQWQSKGHCFNANA